MKLNKLLLLGSLFITISASAQDLQQKLKTAFDRLQQDSQCRYASVSLTVMDAKTGELVFAANPDMGLATASTLKTLTSATAFYLLGKDFQYQTQIGYSGTISADGILNGDIIIKGGGDPTLGSWRWETTKERNVLATMASAIQKAGIKKISGRVIGDASIFGTQSIPEGWIWQDIGNYYGAGTSGLSWRENQFDVKLRTGPSGSLIGVNSTVPAMPYYQFKSELANAPAGTGDKAYGFLPVGSQTFYLRGTYATDQSKKSISLALPDAAYDAAFRLADTLKRLGITVSGNVESASGLAEKGQSTPVIAQPLATITSPTLSKIIYWLNQKSVNLYAEQLIKTIAWKAGKPVTTANGVSVLKDFWKDKGIDPNALNIVDGSGLSPGDRVTTQTLARILKTVKTESWFGDYFESLPTYNGMKMKSGTINDGLSYAGYQTKGGRELSFAIIVNNYSGSTSGMRQKLFRVLDELK
ncbi:D-alanyl-D-alanine carboxypeptidase/D-alanyl-D-alanine endopeptidase [Mucilaginibacter myungsuensis]|uniref:D-alanyl-D-alanine carboxypeptidase/D-alanyl-D-alanine-endopeptidase n=1 Tax=Mucilaginibacter myungsuensis TaxID=649104 RepID=A0A929KY12_9SPHI|nr:D-alanyl-D-alanine carboxypeptidase/D-alanyl-D-alanine-endopeptidase [Mucilaginibacter myungsuensis]MBE9662548.1 D-alanyl-D-alanine carboxypeptidase/D-alanyl-D-alanine-endopeptidase [Mucilaginibacter myungsuensis]MDN3597967.1 D-alanyl-D-alanine carboxypeptidase/D-alanyl-D-alanine-endopeptidase [Mucilaginibacter myungsuensis]